MKLTTHLHLVLRSKNEWSYTPTWCGAHLRNRDSFIIFIHLVRQAEFQFRRGRDLFRLSVCQSILWFSSRLTMAACSATKIRIWWMCEIAKWNQHAVAWHWVVGPKVLEAIIRERNVFVDVLMTPDCLCSKCAWQHVTDTCTYYFGDI